MRNVAPIIFNIFTYFTNSLISCSCCLLPTLHLPGLSPLLLPALWELLLLTRAQKPGTTSAAPSFGSLPYFTLTYTPTAASTSFPTQQDVCLLNSTEWHLDLIVLKGKEGKVRERKTGEALSPILIKILIFRFWFYFKMWLGDKYKINLLFKFWKFLLNAGKFNIRSSLLVL